MKFDGQARHPQFDLSGGLCRGPKYIQRAARDPIGLPEAPDILDLLKKNLCRVELGENCYVIKGMTGEIREIQYHWPMEKWVQACEELLKIAMDSVQA